MNVIAVCQADLETTPLGTRSRLADELDGAAILKRTVERLRAVQRVEAVFVLVPSGQLEPCTKLLEHCDVEVRAHQVDPPPWARLVKAARKWSLDGWRGGLGGTCSFDEYVDCRLLDGLLGIVKADAVLACPPAAPLFDPGLADGMIQLLFDADEQVRLTFAQAPPGITGLVLRADLIKELVEKSAPIGWVFGYLPDSPQKDLIFQSCCYAVPAELRYASARLVADTDRSMKTITALPSDSMMPGTPSEGADSSQTNVSRGLKPAAQVEASARATTRSGADYVVAPAEIGRWLLQREAEYVAPLPHEVEIELTTDDPYPDSLLRPRGRRVPHRGPIDPQIVRGVVSEMARYDDALVVLGGFGDPLRHPEFIPILESIRNASEPQASVRADAAPEPQASACTKRPATRTVPGPFGLAVSTPAAHLTDEHIEAMIRYGVDVLHVWLDAWSPDLYGRLQSPDDPASASLEHVRRRLERVVEICRQQDSATPIVLPAMTKARENVHELDDFHDGWIRRVGAVHIAGYNRHARQCEDRAVISMAPPQRAACRRISTRCLILADGRVAACDQDLNARHVMGSLHERSLEEIWNGLEFRHLRESHRAGRFDPNPLCAACDEWHRP